MKDTIIADLIAHEEKREREGLELIPSENYVSSDVLTALGSVFTNKYSEGYPGKRYYGGQEFTDQVEQLAIDRAKQLFGADHANVQPHSGASANEAVYFAWLKPGDTVLAMDLGHGGHLTHGAPVTRSAQTYNFIRYKMKDIETGEIDYDHLRELALEHKPKIILAGFSGYPRDLDYGKFAAIGNEVGALLMADMAHIAGLIAAGVKENPFDYGFHVITTTTHKTLQPEFKDYATQILKNAAVLAGELQKRGFKLITGGTSNHLILADVQKSFGIDGKVAEEALDKIGLTLNKNSVPDDPNPPFRPSGIRLGTPALTTRGLKEEHMMQIAEWMYVAIDARGDESKLESLCSDVKNFLNDF